jgi:hypothetical protein
MLRVTAISVLVFLGLTGTLAAQSQPEIVRTWNVRWVEVSDRLGNHKTVPVLAWAESEPPEAHVRYTSPPQVSIVASLEDEFRTARLSGNASALSRILSDDFVDTNQDGVFRNKAEVMERARSLKIRSLVTSRARITFTGSTVIITGEQAEENFSGTVTLLFSRVYIQEPSKEWRLLTSTQFRRP